MLTSGKWRRTCKELIVTKRMLPRDRVCTFTCANESKPSMRTSNTTGVQWIDAYIAGFVIKAKVDWIVLQVKTESCKTVLTLPPMSRRTAPTLARDGTVSAETWRDSPYYWVQRTSSLDGARHCAPQICTRNRKTASVPVSNWRANLECKLWRLKKTRPDRGGYNHFWSWIAHSGYFCEDEKPLGT